MFPASNKESIRINFFSRTVVLRRVFARTGRPRFALCKKPTNPRQAAGAGDSSARAVTRIRAAPNRPPGPAGSLVWLTSSSRFQGSRSSRTRNSPVLRRPGPPAAGLSTEPAKAHAPGDSPRHVPPTPLVPLRGQARAVLGSAAVRRIVPARGASRKVSAAPVVSVCLGVTIEVTTSLRFPKWSEA